MLWGKQTLYREAKEGIFQSNLFYQKTTEYLHKTSGIHFLPFLICGFSGGIDYVISSVKVKIVFMSKTKYLVNERSNLLEMLVDDNCH